jgi:deoxyribonuclease V
MKNLQSEPDMLIIDGHGIAHPRAFGIACHVGVLFDTPAFGCGKSLLYGHYHEPQLKRGSIEPLIAKDQTIGNVVRTRDKVKPVFVSVGHKMDLDTVTDLVLECSGKYPQLELPENYSALSL